jgi:hypothetical protein
VKEKQMDYVRTNEEITYQRTYEAKEAANHGSATIHYRIVQETPPPDIVTRKFGWRVCRRAGGMKEEMSQWFFRRIEAIDYANEQLKKDSAAAKRLGVHVHLTMDR